MVNGNGARPLGKNRLAELLGMDAGAAGDHDERVDRTPNRRAVVVAVAAAVAVALAVRTTPYPALAAVLAGVGAGVGAGLVRGATGSDAVAGLLAGVLVVGVAVVAAALAGVGVTGVALVPNYPFVWFTYLVTLPFAVVFAGVTTAGVGGYRDRLAE